MTTEIKANTLSKKATRELIESTFYKLERVIECTRDASELYKAVEIATKQEREHRGMGRRFCNDYSMYKNAMPFRVIAEYFVGRSMLQGAYDGFIPCPDDILSMRQDILIGKSLGASYSGEILSLIDEERKNAFLLIDYSEDLI